MNKLYVKSLNEFFNVDGPDWIIDDPNSYTVERTGPSYDMNGRNNPMWGKTSAQKGKVWITDGKTNVMVFPNNIPEGWYKGRVNVLSDAGKKKCLKHLKENNPNAKKYKIIYRDGTKETVHQLSTWAKSKGHNYSTIKAIVHRSKYKKERQFECYNASTYYIKEIVPL